MNIAEEFAQGRIACELGGCARTATIVVKDLGHLYGQGPFPTEIVQIGPDYFYCELHKRDSYSFERVNGAWVRN